MWHDHTTFHTTVPGTRAHGHVSGLRPAVTYHFRMYADNELGRSQASDVGIARQRYLQVKSPLRFPSTLVSAPAPLRRLQSAHVLARELKQLGHRYVSASEVDRYSPRAGKKRDTLSHSETNLSLRRLF